ncbi:MAG: hypothetical protein GTO08_01990, partial [Deltaproteobacteria bacterium]|nr:hypothetical protein [Deltaproteobacteria bacterium]
AEEIEIGNGRSLKGKIVIPYIKNLSRFEKLLEWFARRKKDTAVIKFLLHYDLTKDILKSKKETQALIQQLKKEFADLSEEVLEDEEHQSYRVQLQRNGFTLNIDNEFLKSPDFRELKSL